MMHAALGPVRVMTTHLEYYSAVQRQAQAAALAALHLEECRHATTPPVAQPPGTPFQSRPHTTQAVLCGDFNMTTEDAGYRQLTEPGEATLVDAWPLAHPGRPQDPTFRLHDDRYGSEPVACDFVFVSEALAPQVRSMRIDGQTQASDHQPVLLVLEA